MGTTAQKLQAIQNSKAAIKSAIEAKGVSDVGDVLADYATKIGQISGGGSSGDPRYEVSEQGALSKKSFAVNWFNDVTSISNNGLDNAYNGCDITSVSFPNLTTIGNNGMQSAFYSSSLTSIDLSKVTTIGTGGLQNAFQFSSLTSIDLSGVTSVPNNAFYNAFRNCRSLRTVLLKKLSSAGSNAFNNTFNGCTALELVDMSEATAVLSINSNTFQNTNSTFKVVVPDSLYSSWIAATNWSSIASQIVKVSDYTPAS